MAEDSVVPNLLLLGAGAAALYVGIEAVRTFMGSGSAPPNTTTENGLAKLAQEVCAKNPQLCPSVIKAAKPTNPLNTLANDVGIGVGGRYALKGAGEAASKTIQALKAAPKGGSFWSNLFSGVGNAANSAEADAASAFAGMGPVEAEAGAVLSDLAPFAEVIP